MSGIIDCLLPATLSALSGQSPPIYQYMLTPPANLTAEVSSPPSSQKLLRGNVFPNMIYTESFAVGWPNGMDITEAKVQMAADAMEDAWQALIVDGGWPQPVSSELYYIWVILDDDYAGSGYTTEYPADEYPEGYPVIFLNPEYSEDNKFWTSLAAHEFNHAVQYGMRDYSYGANDDEDWYWEASAEWGAELSLPNANAYGPQTWYYMSNSGARYSSMDGYHQYGMSVVNAHLEEHVSGEGGMLAAWVEASTRPMVMWDELIPEANGVTLDELWGGFTSSVTSMDFNDAVYYFPPEVEGPVTDGKSGALPYLGTHYYNVQQSGSYSATGEVILAAPSGWGLSVTVNAGDILAVTGRLDQINNYTLHYSEDVTVDTGTTDTGDSSTQIDTSEGLDDSGFDGDRPPKQGCGCSSTPSGRGFGWHLFGIPLFALIFVNRRR